MGAVKSQQSWLPLLVAGASILLLVAAEAHDSRLTMVAPLLLLSVLGAFTYRWLATWRSLLGLVAAVILFIPIKRYSLPASLPFQLEPYRILVFIVIAAWLLALLADPKVRLRRTEFDGPILFYALAITFSLLMNVHRVSSLSQDVFKTLLFFSSFFLLYYLIASVLRSRRDIDFVVTILAGGGVVLAFSAVIESRTGYNIFNHLSSVMPFLVYQGGAELIRGGRLRVLGSAQHPIAFGAVLIMLAPLAVYRAQQTKKKLWWVGTFLLVLGALATGSRTAVTMLFAAAVVYFIFRRGQLRRIWPALLPALVVIHFAIPGTLGETLQAFLPKGGIVAQQYDAPAGNARLSTLGPVLHTEVAPDPAFGEGFGTRLTTPSPTTPIPNAPITDDQWLASLAETGIVGIAALIWLFVRYFRRLKRVVRAEESARAHLLTATAASVTSYSVGMLTYDALSFIQVTFILFILLALGAAALATPASEWQPDELERFSD